MSALNVSLLSLKEDQGSPKILSITPVVLKGLRF